MATQIRPLRAGDEAGWRDLWTAYLDFYETSVDEAVYRATFDRLLSDDPHEFHARVAERDGRLIGLVHYLFHRHCWRVENVVYLQDLYVRRGRCGGVPGGLLADAGLQRARAAAV